MTSTYFTVVMCSLIIVHHYGKVAAKNNCAPSIWCNTGCYCAVLFRPRPVPPTPALWVLQPVPHFQLLVGHGGGSSGGSGMLSPYLPSPPSLPSLLAFVLARWQRQCTPHHHGRQGRSPTVSPTPVFSSCRRRGRTGPLPPPSPPVLWD